MKKFIVCFAIIISSFSSLGQTDFPLETVLQKGHSQAIKAYDFSSDDRFVITGSYDNVLILWDFNSGKQIRTFSGHSERIRSLQFSPDDRYILSVSADHTVKLFETLTGNLVRSFEKGQLDFFSGFFSHSGKYIYALDNRDGVHVWETASGDFIGLFSKEYSAHDQSNIIHPDETMILSQGGYDKVYVLSLLTKDTLLTLPFEKAYSMSFSQDGKWIAVSSRKLFASVFSAETGELIHTYREGEEKCDGCNTQHAFVGEGKQLVTMSSKVPAILWDVRSGKKLKSLFSDEDTPSQLSVSPSGKLLLASFDEKVFVYDLKSGKERLAIEADENQYVYFSFSNAEKYIISPEKKGGLAIWNVISGRKERSITGFLNVAETGKLPLSYSNWFQQGILHSIRHRRNVQVSPDGKYVLIGAVGTSAFVIQLSDGRVVHELKGHEKAVVGLAYSKDGKQIATGSADRLIKIWDAESGREVKSLRGHQETIFDLAFSADGKTLLAGSWDGTLRIWDVEKETYQYIELSNNSPYRVGFTPNELYLVTCDLGDQLTFWEKDSKKEFRSLTGHTKVVGDFDFNGSGEYLVTSSWDGTVKYWHVLTGMLVGRAHSAQGGVYGVAHHSSKSLVAYGCANGEVRLWNPLGNEDVQILRGHATAVTSVAFVPGSDQLVSLSVDGVMKVWDLSNNTEKYTRVQLSSSEWLATSSTGQFDGSKQALGWVNYVKGGNVVNVNSVFDTYFTPNLIRQIQSGELLEEDRGEMMQPSARKVPEVDIYISDKGTRGVLALDSIFQSSTESVTLFLELDRNDVPLEEIRIYNNGKLVKRELMEENITFRGDAKKRMVNIPLGHGLNELTVVAVNQERTESIPQQIRFEYQGDPDKTDLFILAIGINQYKNPSYNLNYAVSDAKALVKALGKRTDSLFDEITIVDLFDKEATKPEIEAAIADFQSNMGSEDVFLFYYAGHGIMNEEEFFLVTHDVTNLYAQQSEVAEKAVSARELMDYAIDLPAEKQVFILDACHSGGAISSFAMRGNEREKALAQLARSTGTFFLTAAQDAQFANEVGDLNHGLFTYALLEVLDGLEGEDKEITVNEMKTYVENRVPELSKTYHGSPQYPTGYSFGQDFPLLILK